MAAWISGDLVQTWLGADKIADDAAASLAQVVTDTVQDYLGRDISRQTIASEYYDTTNTDYVLLNNWPIISIGSVALNGETLQEAAPQQPGWRLDVFNKRKLYLGRGRIMRGTMNVLISNLVVGYDTTAEPGADGALPQNVVVALQLTAAAIFNAQAADPNLAAESTAGVFSGSFYPTGVGAVPPGARTLLLNELRVAP